MIIRSVQSSDLPAMLEIAGKKGPGFNSLPNDKDVLQANIMRSIDSFSGKLTIGEGTYCFVMENVENQRIMGTASIEHFIGHPWPFYKYRLSTIAQISKCIDQYRKHPILTLASDHEGASELGALYLEPASRGKGYGSFLSRTRCLFIAEFPHYFSDHLIADMRGVSDSNAISPFWEVLGKPFFNMSYAEACYIKTVKGPQFLLDLMPRYPIYLELLPESVQQVIGKTHPDSTPGLHVLEKEGFTYQKYVDIFDGGPTIEVAKEKLRTVRESQKAVVISCKKEIQRNNIYLLSNTQLDFRATLAPIDVVTGGEVVLETAVANVLNVSIGDTIRYCLLR